MSQTNKEEFKRVFKFICLVALVLLFCHVFDIPIWDYILSGQISNTGTIQESTDNYGNYDIIEETGSFYEIVNGNSPYFEDSQLSTDSYEVYSELDELGRCGVAVACVGIDIMPAEDRESIGSVKPTGWQSVKYDCVDGKYLYNRCHLIGFQLTGENANKRNLITGTRSFNVDGMLPFENMVADYVVETNNHVMYRVTPVFVDDELVARGVYIEAYSVEDAGAGICFNVYVFNKQDGVEIDYKTGESWLVE